MEPPITSSLPGGILFPCSVVQVASVPQQKWTVQLRNESNRDVILQSNAVVAEVHAIESVLPRECEKDSVPNSQCSSKPEITFDFVDSPLSQEWKDRVSKKLNDMSEVFAQHDLDFGRTSVELPKSNITLSSLMKLRLNKEHGLSTLMIWLLFDGTCKS